MGKKKITILSILIIFAIFFIHAIFRIHLDPADDQFTNIDLCPACFGDSLCPQFYHGDISLIGISKLTYLKSSKNVFSAKLLKERVILKKLAHDTEITDMDKFICKMANLQNVCKVNDAIKLLVKNSLVTQNYNHLLKLMSTSTDVSHCPSNRLLTYMLSKMHIKEKDFPQFEELELYKLGEMMYSLLLNPEAVILQTFPQAEGWPFPQYYGSCGRVIVEEYVGRTLMYFEDSPWKQRVDISYQLLLIAQMLTENASNFSLYMTDVNMDNFAVRSDGTVLLVDVENIVIVDHLKNRKDQSFHGKLHHSKGEFCKDCLNFSFEDLCNYDQSDHNYYAICKGLLIVGSYFSSKGLLHSIPEEINAQTNLLLLVEECANPSKNFSRFHVVPKLLQVMKSLL